MVIENNPDIAQMLALNCATKASQWLSSKTGNRGSRDCAKSRIICWCSI